MNTEKKRIIQVHGIMQKQIIRICRNDTWEMHKIIY